MQTEDSAAVAQVRSASNMNTLENGTLAGALQQKTESVENSLTGQLHEAQSSATFLQKAYQNKGNAYVANLTSWAIWALLVVLCYIFVYHPEHEHGLFVPEDADPVEVFHKNHFGCFHNMHDCICTCFCLPLRWADTMDMASIFSYKVAFEIFMGLTLLNVMTGGQIVFGLFTLVAMIYGRQEIRRMLGIPYGNCQSCIFDCCFIFWCPCCAIIQEARVVRDAVHASLRALPASSLLPPDVEQKQMPPKKALGCLTCK